jgi:hypothetical protein
VFKLNFHTNPDKIDADTEKFLSNLVDEKIGELTYLNALRKQPKAFRQKYEIEALAEGFLEKLRLRRKHQEEILTDREKAERAYVLAKFVKPEECQHLKGGAMTRWGWDKFAGPKFGMYKDYNIAVHIFQDGSTKAWCLNGCGFKLWKHEATDEQWAKVADMMKTSTNKVSSTERIIEKKDADVAA